MSLRSRIVTAVLLNPGLSAGQIAALLGKPGDKSLTAQVGQLEEKRELRRTGLGTAKSPYRYYVREN